MALEELSTKFYNYLTKSLVFPVSFYSVSIILTLPSYTAAVRAIFTPNNLIFFGNFVLSYLTTLEWAFIPPFYPALFFEPILALPVFFYYLNFLPDEFISFILLAPFKIYLNKNVLY